MLLKKLIKNLNPETGALKIKGICFDSRKVKKGDLFVAINGEKYNGNDYIAEAISRVPILGLKFLISFFNNMVAV